MVIPIFIPHKGCPFDCIFCNQKKISGQTEEMTVDRMKSIILSHLETASKDAFIEIGFYGGSFTGIEIEQQIKYLETAFSFVRSGSVHEIRLSTRPDYISQEILEYLKSYKVGTIELGAQSMDDHVLKLSCRGHRAVDVFRASEQIKRSGIRLGIQTMVGLPGATAEKDSLTAEEVIKIKPDLVRIYPALVIRDTMLEQMFMQGIYTPLTLEQAVNLCARLLDRYESNGICVIRIGLQPTDHINEGMDVLAGPFHPAFRQLVNSRRLRDRMEEIILAEGLSNKNDIKIEVSKYQVSDTIGQKKQNIEYLKSRFKFAQIKVVGIEKPEGDICISVCK